MIKALFFDFDGLILDTETPEFEAWQAIYREQGEELPFEQWAQIVGGYGISQFDPAIYLNERCGGGLNLENLRARQKSGSEALLEKQAVLPGVVELLCQAREAHLHLAVISSSHHAWVDGHLARLGLSDFFEFTLCADDVPAGRTKPHPDLYLKGLERLRLAAQEAVVFEDSLNGVRAAKAAGIYTVAVPNEVTRRIGVEGADCLVHSLREFSLSKLILSFFPV
ncbi:MAG: HAD family hydrolase [Anaerolineae bacterium]